MNAIKRLVPLLLCISCLSPNVGAADPPAGLYNDYDVFNSEYREWKDDTGGFSTRAKFVYYNDGNIGLQRVDGKKVYLRFEKLADMDKEYVKVFVANLQAKREEGEAKREKEKADEKAKQEAINQERAQNIANFVRASKSIKSQYWYFGEGYLGGGLRVGEGESSAYLSFYNNQWYSLEELNAWLRKEKHKCKVVDAPDLQSLYTSMGVRVAAQELRYALPSPNLEGKVVKADQGEAIINVGILHCIRPGMSLSVLRLAGEIRDPDTGKVLGNDFRNLGELKVREVQPEFARAALVPKEGKEAELQIGDVVRFDSKHGAIAVLLMGDADDAKTDGGLATKQADSNGRLSINGKVISEKLTTEMVSLGMPVVERTLLERVLNQLKVQKFDQIGDEKIFSPDLVKEIGHQVGASFIVGGTLTEFREATHPIWKVKVHSVQTNIRLIDIETGEIIKAVSGRVYADVAR